MTNDEAEALVLELRSVVDALRQCPDREPSVPMHALIESLDDLIGHIESGAGRVVTNKWACGLVLELRWTVDAFWGLGSGELTLSTFNEQMNSVTRGINDLPVPFGE